jgi:formate-dependent nitrite reductase cytochrome c552 subunit
MELNPTVTPHVMARTAIVKLRTDHGVNHGIEFAKVSTFIKCN